MDSLDNSMAKISDNIANGDNEYNDALKALQVIIIIDLLDIQNNSEVYKI